MNKIVLLGSGPGKWEFVYKCKGKFIPTTNNEIHSLIMGGKHITALIIDKLTEFAIDTINKAEYVYLFDNQVDKWKNLEGELPSNFVVNPTIEKIFSHLELKSDNPELEYNNWYNK